LRRIGIIGIGWYGFKPNTREVSFREMMFEAAVRAYEDAGSINPRNEVDTFISCQEDFWEGIAISDEFAPDPIGGAMRPTMTVTGDGLQCVTHAVMHIFSGLAEISVVEAHSKASDILTLSDIIEFAMDPIYIRPIATKFSLPYHFIAGLEANLYMKLKGITREDLALVVKKNKKNGLKVSRAAYAANIEVENILNRKMIVEPLTDLDIAPFTDAAIVVVLASEDIARRYTDTPIWIDGIYFATDSSNLETANLGRALYMEIAAEKAYKMAKIESPKNQINVAFVDDRYSYKELQHIEALKLSNNPVSGLREGEFHVGGKIPVNPYGGHLAKGVPLEASGLSLLLDAIEFLRNEGYERAVIGSWRGIPTFTGSVAVVSR
jgi:acetyl-CoA C-acetyltransferase